MAVTTFDEFVGSRSPATAGFSREGGRATLQLLIDGPDVTTAISTLLGTVSRGEDGKLRRTNPIAHPQFPWMVCDRISNIQGLGDQTKTVAIQPVEGIALSYYALYPAYIFTCEFVHHPYAFLTDDAIQVEEGEWDDELGSTEDTVWAREWERHTSYEMDFSAEVITAQYGQMKFRREDAAAPSGYAFPGQPRMYLGKATLKFTWHFVPADIIEDADSPMVKYLGRVNQRQFGIFEPGSLLYTAVGVRRYLPPVPYSVILGGQASFSLQRYADFQFVFEFVDRTSSSPPDPTGNDNWLAKGHNLQPWYGPSKGFNYVTAVGADPDTTRSNWAPVYESFPIEWLWTDPVVL